MISQMDVWHMGQAGGAPSLRRTLEEFVRHGWSIIFVTGSSGPTTTPIPGVTRIPCMPRFLSGARQWRSRPVGDSAGVRRDRVGGWLRRAVVVPGGPGTVSEWVRGRIKAFLFLVYSIPTAVRATRGMSPKVVYGYEVHGVLAASVVSWMRRVPRVARYQGTFLSAVPGRLRQGLLFPDHALAFALRGDICVMTNDGTNGLEVLRSYGARESDVLFLINGVDRVPLAGRRDEGSVPSGRVVCASRLVHWKRVDRVLEVFAAATASIREAHLVVCGDGEERLRLEELARTLGIADRVEFAGALSHDATLRMIETASVFVSAYDLSNLGNPILEAIAAGRACCVLDNGWHGGFFRDRVNCRLAASPVEMAAQLKCLLTCDQAREELEASCRVWAAENLYTWRVRIEAEAKAIDAMIDEAYA